MTKNMACTASDQRAVSSTEKTGPATLIRRVVLVLFLTAFTFASLSTLSFSPSNVWPDFIFLLVAGLFTVVSLTRQLPLQSVLLAAAVILGVYFTMSSVAAFPGFPGPHRYYVTRGLPRFAAEFVHQLIWPVVLLNARAMARLLPQRDSYNFGFRVLIIAAVLIFAFQ